MSALNAPYFVRLDLADASGKSLSSNFYWLPKALEEFDWDKTNYFTTPAKYADMTALASLPAANVEWNSLAERHGEEQTLRVTLHNVGESLAFMVHVSLRHRRNGDDIAPVLWDDNYISLLPGESRTLTATVNARDLRGIAPLVRVDGWNIKTLTR